jgi:hypothetical protein
MPEPINVYITIKQGQISKILSNNGEISFFLMDEDIAEIDKEEADAIAATMEDVEKLISDEKLFEYDI